MKYVAWRLKWRQTIYILASQLTLASLESSQMKVSPYGEIMGGFSSMEVS